MEQKPIISVRGLRKVYQVGDEKVVALGNINLEILQGQIVCIVGTSGSGKSTLQIGRASCRERVCLYV